MIEMSKIKKETVSILSKLSHFLTISGFDSKALIVKFWNFLKFVAIGFELFSKLKVIQIWYELFIFFRFHGSFLVPYFGINGH